MPDASRDTLKGSNTLLREATVQDALAIAEIYNESIAAGDSTMDDALKTPDDIRRQIAGFTASEKYLLLERSPGTVLGWGIIKKYSDRPGYRFCCETSVYLRRNETGRGYGSRLQDALIAKSTTLGYHHIVAKIWANNQVSIALHKKHGFEMVGVQKEIGFKNGQWIDVAIMQRVLP